MQNLSALPKFCFVTTLAGLYSGPQLVFDGAQPGHLELLIRATHDDAVLRTAAAAAFTVAGNVDCHTSLPVDDVVLPRVDRKAETADFLSDGLPQPGALLADTTREDERIDGAAEGDVVGADVAADAVDEEVEGEAVRGLVAGGDLAKVGGTCEGFPAGLLVEDLLRLGDVEVGCRGRGELAGVAGVVEYETVWRDILAEVPLHNRGSKIAEGGNIGNKPRINAAATSRARKSCQGSQSHTRIPAFTVLDGACARAASEVQRDDVEAADLFAQFLGDGAGDEGVANAVESVLAQVIILGHSLVDGICGNVLRDGRVELRVKAGHVNGVGQLFDAGINYR